MSARSHTTGPSPFDRTPRPHARAADARRDLDPTDLGEPVGDDTGGAVLLEAELRVGVQVLVQGEEVEGHPSTVTPEPASADADGPATSTR